MDGCDPIDLGAAIFSLHDPHRGYEREFNRYYERDHMYAAAILAPWTIAGQRWVATAPLKRLRYPVVGPFGPASAGSYLTMFWITADHLADQQAWVNEQMVELSRAGRVFEHRDVPTATAYDYLGSYRRDIDGVPPFQALDHRYGGCVWMVFERAPQVALGAFRASLLQQHLAEHFAGTAVALACAFTPRPKEPWWPAAAPEVPGVGDRIVVAAFVEADPRAVWDDVFAGLGAVVDSSGGGSTLLVAPFIPTIPGTDAYVDELW